MARFKFYLDIDVLTAARQRVSHIYDTFDNVLVMFSGGKDSMATLEVTREEAERRGRLPLDVVFLDEEIIPPQVVDTVKWYREQDWLRMHWLTVPLKNQKYVLGTIEDIVMWGEGRDHVRERPKWGITGEPGMIYRQHEMDGFVAKVVGLKGRLAFMLGIRAAESLIRFRSVVNKLNQNYICASTDARVKICKPIYDWLDDDIFKFLHEQGLPLSEVYRAQWLAGDRMRVATPLHAEARHQNKIAAWAPEYVDRIRAIFPDFGTQLRYEKQADPRKRIAPYVSQGIDGAEHFINDYIVEPTQRDQAMKQFKQYRVLHGRDPEAYPVAHFLKAISTGVVRKMVLGVTKARA